MTPENDDNPQKSQDQATLHVSDVVQLEQMIAEAGTPLSRLMRGAGEALAQAVMRRFTEPCRVCVLAGAGNNGGDGWVAAEFLAASRYPTVVLSPVSVPNIKAQPAHDAARAAIAAVDTHDRYPLMTLVQPDANLVADAINRADVIIDALLGTGFNGSQLRGDTAQWIEAANTAQRDCGAFVVAADVPSGLSAETGQVADACMRADITVTMLVKKPGLCAPDAAEYCGAVEVAGLCNLEPFRPFINGARLN